MYHGKENTMAITAVQLKKNTNESHAHFRAIAGTRQSIGRTAGEALDALLAEEGDTVESAMIVIKRVVPVNITR
jgi:hypothetical protein